MEFSGNDGAARDTYQARKRALLIDVDANGGEDNYWNQEEEIELGEQELFLSRDYYHNKQRTSTKENGLSPRRSHSSLRGGSAHYKQLIGEEEETYDSTSINMNEILVDDLRTEVIGVDRLGSPSGEGNSSNGRSVAINHRNPKYEQFCTNQPPPSRADLIASAILISVIFLVTILPIMLPKSSTDAADEAPDSNNPFNHQTNKTTPEHGDFRCKCICPPLPEPPGANSSSAKAPPKRQYVGNTSPNQCNCDNVVLRQLANFQLAPKDFCNSCECKYQSRNTKTIKRNVVFYIVVLSGLSVFMVVQYLLKYFQITRRNLPRRLKWLSHQVSDAS